MEIVTGYRGEAHITSDDHQALNQGVIGNIILPIGMRLQAELVTANTLRIYDGTAVMGGVEFRVMPGTYDEVTIDNGEQDTNRIDLVCARYQKNGSTGVESMSWAVVKGTPTSGTPTTPSYPMGDIVSGATDVYFPLYRVTLTGLNAAVKSLCSTLTTMTEHQQAFEKLPKVIKMSSVVVNSTAKDYVPLWTIPAEYDLEKVVVNVTNPYYKVNAVVPIGTYIDGNRKAHAKVNVSRISGYCRFNYIIWYWGN